MNNLDESLPDLMRRATETLEPGSTDLVERGMRRGVRLRRRRTALLGVSGAGAVLATAGIIVGGTHLFAGSPGQAPAAGAATAKPSATSTATAAKTASPAQTLKTLRELLPENLTQSAPKSSADYGLHHAEVVVDDGKGASLITAIVVTSKPHTTCAGLHGTCKVRPDGAVIHYYANQSIFPFDPAKNPWGIKNTVLEIFWPDGRGISLYSYNAPKPTGVQHTRANPLLSIDDLTHLATSSEWVYPARHVGSAKPDPKNPGAGKPTVPLTVTQQTLKSVLPKGLTFTRPQTWGGGADGFNGASYVVNDGKGAARVEALLQYEVPVTKCPSEGPQHCRVRADRAVVTWSEDEPSYSDERQAVNGVLSNWIEVHYPDGRMISMISYNGPQEKDAQHTRTKPTFSTDQLKTMAGDPAWKFPGTGTK